MKKLLSAAVILMASLFFVGCGGSSGSSGGGGIVPPSPTYSMLYIDDQYYRGIPNIPYMCSSNSGYTDANGGFLFLAGDDCTFDFTGFDGTVYFVDPLFLDYSDGQGVSGVGYDCYSGISGYTYANGGFEYDTDDECTFYL